MKLPEAFMIGRGKTMGMLNLWTLMGLSLAIFGIGMIISFEYNLHLEDSFCEDHGAIGSRGSDSQGVYCYHIDEEEREVKTTYTPRQFREWKEQR